MMIRKLLVFGGMCLAFGLGHLLLAQADQPTPTPEPTPLSPDNCQGETLIALKAELDTLLVDFAENAEADPTAALDSLYSVGQQYQALALACGYIPPNVTTLVINTTDVARVLTVLATLTGDPLRGQLLYNGSELSASGEVLGCAGCHESVGGIIAPLTEGTWTRWDEERSREERFADYTFEQYIVESILLPWDYFVATYPQFTMPDFYHEQLGYQDLADIIAFLESQDQLVP